MKLIITDIDETILHFAEHFEEWMNSIGYPSLLPLFASYDLEKVFGIDRETKLALLNQFAHDFFDEMHPTKDALEVLPRLYADGYNFVAISACADTDHVANLRKKNLERIFGFPWQSVHCVGWDSCKSHILKFYQNSVWVEDNMYHANKGADIGHDTYLIRRPYNKDFNSVRIKMVDSWYDIEKLI